MSLFVKICGITNAVSAETVVEAGADALGFVFAESPRRVTPEQAEFIAADLPAHVLRVAVFRHPSPDEVEAVLERFIPDLIQADHETLVRLPDIATLPVYRDGVGSAPVGGRFLYEGPVSGVGQVVHMDRAAGLARVGEMVLAGGLRPDNVAAAISKVRPSGVDVSSGVESSPGSKDNDLVQSFVAAARAAEERLVST